MFNALTTWKEGCTTCHSLKASYVIQALILLLSLHCGFYQILTCTPMIQALALLLATTLCFYQMFTCILI